MFASRFRVNSLDLQALKFYGRNYNENVLPNNNEITRKTVHIMNRLLDVDKRFKRIIGKKNQFVVIRNPTQNAFSLPNKRLLIYSSLIESCLNNHELSVVLSHEIAHQVLKHFEECVRFRFYNQIKGQKSLNFIFSYSLVIGLLKIS